ncbi:MAG: transcriptional regulator TrmB [Parcubacteria group bacterium]|nr:transcriptional regulator TrmB [Parcubacteria group bacterium]
MTDTKPPQQNSPYIESALKAGLSAKAASVYVVLLESGIALSPKTIILRSGLHRQYVYDGIKELQERELISSVGKDRAIKYGAANPDKLVQEVEKKRIDTLDSVQSLMELYDKSPAGVVEIIRGNRAVIESEFKILEEAKDGDFLDIIGGAGMEWVNLFEGRIEEWEALRKEKGVKLRYIGSGEDVRHNREESVIENESRSIPGIRDIVNISIRSDSVSFNIYQPEVMTIRVKNAAAVESQRALFEVLWNAAK